MRPAATQLERGASLQLEATVTGVDGNPLTGRRLAWRSEDPTIASVDANTGLVTARGRGTTTITATPADRIVLDGAKDTAVATRSEDVHASATIEVFVAYRSIATGNSFSCDVGGGWVECWGGNPGGALGDGTYDLRLTPVRAISAARFTSVSASDDHSCGLDEQGRAFCWGDNWYGQCGTGEWSPLVPTRVSGEVSFTQLATGTDHTCAVTAAGAAWCWGSNIHGQLGTGSSDLRSTVPLKVASNVQLESVSAGNGFTCAVSKGGAAYCWGDGSRGQLGTGGPISPDSASPTPVAVSGGLSFKAVSAGYSYACGVTTTAEVYCWGSRPLGNGLFDTSSDPVRVINSPEFASVSVGLAHTCALTIDGEAYCWGTNGDGELGAPVTDDPSWLPVPVSGDLLFSEISAARFSGQYPHTCGITLDRRGVWCWGSNALGQLGNGTRADGPTFVPVPVTGQQP